MQIVVLAGGLGTRLMPLTENIPKSMIRIMGKPFVEYQLELFRRGGITDVVLCVGHMAEKIMSYLGDGRRFNINLVYSVENNHLLGTGGALKKAEPLLDDHFLLTYGDSYLQVDYIDIMEQLKASNKLGVMAVYRNFNRYDRSNVVVERRLVKEYDKKRRKPGMDYIDYGISALRNEALSLIPKETPIGLEKLFKEIIDRKELLAYEVKDRFFEIGSPPGLEEFKQFAASLEQD